MRCRCSLFVVLRGSLLFVACCRMWYFELLHACALLLFVVCCDVFFCLVVVSVNCVLSFAVVVVCCLV